MSKTTSYETLKSIGEIQLMKKFYPCLYNFSEILFFEFSWEYLLSRNYLYL